MPRTNPGLDYFPVDVDMESDDKIELIEARHGIVGFGVVMRLLMRIYRNSYYYQWGEKEQLLFSKRINVDINTVNAIIKDSLEWGFFDKTLFEKYEILTSKGVQTRYLEATSRRQRVELVKEYLLIDQNTLNDYKNTLIVDIKSEDVDITTQSKVKESKVKESISSENFSEDSLEMRMVNHMITKILESYPGAKVPEGSKKQKWASTFDRIMRIDGKTAEDIRAVMTWIYQDDFWCTNIRSPEKLREKWDTVYLQMVGQSRKKTASPYGPKPGQKPGESDVDYLDRIRREKWKQDDQ